MMNHGGNESLPLFGICLITVIPVAIILFFRKIFPFMSARANIKMELSRSVGEEYIFWKSELKKLYVSLIPIVGRILVKFIR